MKVVVYGIGYVGCVSMGCLARDGHNVIGIDPNARKVQQIKSAQASVLEPGLEAIIKEGHAAGNLTARRVTGDALTDAAVSLICVGTPSRPSGHLDLRQVMAVAQEIGVGIRTNPNFHVVLIRSTVLPGTNKVVGSIISEHSGKHRGKHFEVVSNPEFLREATALEDYYHPALHIAGTHSLQAFRIVERLYSTVTTPLQRTSIATAEMLKLVNNTWHAVKVTFANEVGVVCKASDVDPCEVMDLFCQDTTLNLSPYYLHPGFAYGGSCLPKDLKSFSTLAHDLYINTPLVNAVAQSNVDHIHRLIDLVTEKEYHRIGILGLSFKAGTDDLRNSPIVEVAEILLGRGYDLRIYDRNVFTSNLTGKNREFMRTHLPHLEKLMRESVEDVINGSELIIVANHDEMSEAALEHYPQKYVIDLVHAERLAATHKGTYDGICWKGAYSR
jgi:GDP-mannose 6-dehydrogenase